MFKRFGVGFAVGYVFGARAGQKRYEQMTELADRALDLPWVQQLVEGGQAMAMGQGRRVLSNLRERARWIDETGENEEEEPGAYDEEEDEEEDASMDEDEGAYDEEEDESMYDDEEEKVYGR